MRISLTLHTTALAAALLLPGALAAQRDYDDRDRRRGERMRIDTTVSLGGRAEVDLSLVSGEIRVRGWERDEAQVRAETERGTLRFESSSSSLRLRQEDGRRSDDARYDVTVPYGARVVMRSVSGELSAIDVRGEVEARTTSGDVRIEGTRGRTQFESISGEVEARRLDGPVRGKSISGNVSLTEIEGDVEVETVSGEITLNQSGASFVRLETTSGDLAFTGPLDRSGRYEFNSHSGTITLALPTDAGAQMSVETFSGELDTAFPLTIGPNSRGGRPRRFEFTLGNGGARVTAGSFSGDIKLQRSGSTRSSTLPRK